MFNKDKVFKITSLFNIKADDEADSIQIQGYANTTSKDRVGDVIVENAWRQGGLDNYAKNPILLAYHDHSKPIGTVSEYSVDSNGLSVIGNISKSANEVYDLVKDGVLKAFSVGFRIKDADYDAATDIFVIKDLELLEISVVSVPANSDSIFSLKKSFSDDNEYKEFKETFKSVDKTDTNVSDTTDTKEKHNMNELEKLQAELADIKAKQKADDDARAKEIEITAAVEKALADRDAKDAEAKAKVKTGADIGNTDTSTTGAEALLAEVEKRLTDNNADVAKSIEGLQADLKEKSDELIAMQKSKITFEERGGSNIIKASERDAAVLIAKLTGKSVESTKYGAGLIEKAGAHLQGMAVPADWENEFSVSVHDEVREQLVVESLFRNIAMNTPTMQLPINPEAGYAAWINPTAFRSTDDSSTGTAVDHLPTDITLTAYKMAAKTYIGYEEEEDSILPLVGIIKDALTRQIAKAADVAYLRGNGVSYVSPNTPFKGLAQLATDVGAARITTHSIANGGQVTVDELAGVRRKLGVYGLNPADLIYIVCHSVYYDLLEDPDFRTIDMVGTNATILNGQIGSINGSRVIVSGEFATPANNTAGALVVNASNFLAGTLRGLMVEKDKNIEDQKNILVGTRRLGFTDLISGQGVAVLNFAT